MRKPPLHIDDRHSDPSRERQPNLGDILVILYLIVLLPWVFSVLSQKWDSFWRISLTELTLLGVCGSYLHLRKLSIKPLFRWHRVPLGALSSSFIIGVGLAILLDSVDQVITRFLPLTPELKAWVERLSHWENLTDALGVMTGVVILAPVVEESLFRGVIQQYIERRRGALEAVLWGSLIFAFIHLNPSWFLQLTILSLPLGILAYRWGSILPPFIIHSVVNLWGLTYPQLGDRFLRIYHNWWDIGHPLFILLGIIAITLGWQWNTYLIGKFNQSGKTLSKAVR